MFFPLVSECPDVHVLAADVLHQAPNRVSSQPRKPRQFREQSDWCRCRFEKFADFSDHSIHHLGFDYLGKLVEDADERRLPSRDQEILLCSLSSVSFEKLMHM